MGRQHGFLGFNYLFTDTPSPFTVSAVEDCDVVVIEKNPLIKILKKNAELCLLFMTAMSEELIFLNNRLVSLTQKHIRGRIAETLLLLRDTYGTEPDGKTVRAMLSREDIAHLSNMTTSNAIRAAARPSVSGALTFGVSTIPFPPERRSRNRSTRRFIRRRWAKHSQHPVTPGTNRGPSHSDAPTGRASNQGRPARRDSTSNAASSGRR